MTEEVKTDTRTKIIEATAEIMGRESNLNLTIRDIAARAGVNIASINYHFQSKENLMEEVEHVLLKKAGLVYGLLHREGESPGERLIQWGDGLMKFLLEYPGTIYMIVTRVLVSNRVSDGLTGYLNMLNESLVPVIGELTGEEDDETLNYKAMQVMSGVVYPVLLHSGTGKSFFPAISSDTERRSYLSLLVSSLT